MFLCIAISFFSMNYYKAALTSDISFSYLNKNSASCLARFKFRNWISISI